MLEITILDFEPEGTLKFYAYQNAMDYERGFPVNYLNNIYWKDAQLSKGAGPFNNLHDALQHFKMTIQQRRSMKVAETVSNNVMYVDFQTKKKLN